MLVGNKTRNCSFGYKHYKIKFQNKYHSLCGLSRNPGEKKLTKTKMLLNLSAPQTHHCKYSLTRQQYFLINGISQCHLYATFTLPFALSKYLHIFFTVISILLQRTIFQRDSPSINNLGLKFRLRWYDVILYCAEKISHKVLTLISNPVWP